MVLGKLENWEYNSKMTKSGECWADVIGTSTHQTFIALSKSLMKKVQEWVQGIVKEEGAPGASL